MRWLVCGGRDFGDIDRYLLKTYPKHPKILKSRREYHFIMDTLTRLSEEKSIYYKPNDNWNPSDIEIISGKARGVDSVAIDWAICNWCKVHEYPADWNKYGTYAGYKRNVQMLEEGNPDLVIAFTGGKGTNMMVKLAGKASIPVLSIEYTLPGAH